MLVAGLTLAIAPVAAKAELTLEPNSLSFAPQAVGTTSAAQSTTLTLTCTLPTIGCFIGEEEFSPTIAVTPPFSQTNDCPAMMTADFIGDENCTITVSVTPTGTGPISGTLSTGGIDDPTATLTGTGAGSTVAGQAGGKKKCKKKKGKKGAAAAKKKCKRKKKP
jgi:hypothetical protein